MPGDQYIRKGFQERPFCQSFYSWRRPTNKKWYANRHPPPTSNKKQLEASFSLLHLKSITHPFTFHFHQVTLANGKVKSRSVHLDVVTPEAIILSTDEYRIEKGALISLVCILENALLPPEYVFWYQNERMINYDTARGVTVTTMQGKKTSSRLNIQK